MRFPQVAPLLPESPRWLAVSEYPDRVSGSLRCLRGSCAGSSATAGSSSERAVALYAEIEAESAEMIRSARLSQAQQGKTSTSQQGGGGGAGAGAAGTLGMLFSGSDGGQALRVSCSVMILQQLSGINAVNSTTMTMQCSFFLEKCCMPCHCQRACACALARQFRVRS
eukprot:COSAG06_NODE_2261_length_7212_cov_80.772951_10_plen_168_part_00